MGRVAFAGTLAVSGVFVALLAPGCGGSSGGDLFGGGLDGGGQGQDGTAAADACPPGAHCVPGLDGGACVPACDGRACGASDGCGG